MSARKKLLHLLHSLFEFSTLVALIVSFSASLLKDEGLITVPIMQVAVWTFLIVIGFYLSAFCIYALYYYGRRLVTRRDQT